jgi:RNA polymerase sigma factor (sigma-70 family)
MTESLRPWIRSAQQGNKEAVAFITDCFMPLIHHTVRKHHHARLISRDEALSSAYHGMLQCIFEYDFNWPESIQYHITKYVRRHVSNSEREVMKHHKNRVDIYDSGGNDDDVDRFDQICDPKAINPADAIIKKEEIHHVKKIIDQLPHEWQQILILQYKGYSFVEIAKKMYITESVVRHRFYRSLQIIRKKRPRAPTGYPVLYLYTCCCICA